MLVQLYRLLLAQAKLQVVSGSEQGSYTTGFLPINLQQAYYLCFSAYSTYSLYNVACAICCPGYILSKTICTEKLCQAFSDCSDVIVGEGMPVSEGCALPVNTSVGGVWLSDIPI